MGDADDALAKLASYRLMTKNAAGESVPADQVRAEQVPAEEEQAVETRAPRRFWEPRPFLGAPGEVADPVPLPDESKEPTRSAAQVPHRSVKR